MCTVYIYLKLNDWLLLLGTVFVMLSLICLLHFLAETSIISDTSDTFKEDKNR